MNVKQTACCAALLLATVAAPCPAKSGKKSVDLRAAYIQKVQQTAAGQSTGASMGSLWSPNAPLMEVAADYKAHRMNDAVTILVIEATTAQTNGASSQSRQLSFSSGITGAGGSSSNSLDPILAGNSSQSHKGAGSLSADSKLQTSLAGQVVCVLPNGNLIVEAERSYKINGQHDTVVVRGVARPGDIGSANSILSTQLMNLEVEMKGKGLVADGTRGPNIITRTLLKWLGF